MRRARRGVGCAAWIVAVLIAGVVAWGLLRGRPQDLPWTPLDLGRPVGMFTGRKLTALTDDFAQCRRLLDRAGVRYEPLAPVREGASCGYDDGVRMGVGRALEIPYRPANLGVACPVAAALAMWEWNVVAPAARRHYGERVTAIEHFGSYNCRRMYGRDAGSWSEHSTADAVDIAAFRLSDGRRVSVVGDWTGDAADRAFLREVRDGACDLFATVLSPDYNAAHRDHFHLDQARRGTMGGRACR
ncbi:extensin [Sphingomonas sp. Leaf412]|uniref:extensin-like domain-containing protein n=1 Tax=Sphingomonas sp. Leaf412 TaxID=1736370 RepID=UPI0006FE56E9|nr:extensin family protein [Sphingomonas sp. Leaf412]KQT31230.1 extensin [Sphingomonas sp. Leaf412]